jgi:hypothetical protein
VQLWLFEGVYFTPLSAHIALSFYFLSPLTGSHTSW